MKKFLITTGVFIVILSGRAHAQETTHSLAAGNVHPLQHKTRYLNDINMKAMRDFVVRYGDVKDPVWHKSNGYDVVVFYRDSIQYRVLYNSKGDLSIAMKYYEEPRMARDIRALVKSTYYDYKIFIIQEIETPDNPIVYIINLQGDADWKKVRVCGGEMDVLEEYKKGK